MIKTILEKHFFHEFKKYMSKLGVSQKEYNNAFFNNKWIGKKEILDAIHFYGRCDYTNYIKKLIS